MDPRELKLGKDKLSSTGWFSEITCALNMPNMHITPSLPPPSSVGRWWCRPCQAGCIYETTNMKNRSQLSVTAALNRQVCPSVYMLSSVCCYIENLLDSFMFRSRTQRTHAHHSCQKKPFQSLLGCVWVLSLINYKSAFN